MKITNKLFNVFDRVSFTYSTKSTDADETKATYQENWNEWKKLIESVVGNFQQQKLVLDGTESWQNSGHLSNRFWSRLKFNNQLNSASCIALMIDRNRLRVYLEWHDKIADSSTNNLTAHNDWVNHLDEWIHHSNIPVERYSVWTSNQSIQDEYINLESYINNENIEKTIENELKNSRKAWVRVGVLYDKTEAVEWNNAEAVLSKCVEQLLWLYKNSVKDYIPTSDNSDTKLFLNENTTYSGISTEDNTITINDNEVSVLLNNIKVFIKQKGFMYPNHWIENFFLSLKAKPFVILAGVSGTGKTKLVKLFAEAVGATASNGQFSLVPVRPDWSDPSDLLGYKDLSGVFRPGKLTEVLVEASKPSNQHKPYFICLDEMNLARVEHYFSDLLSVLETQEWDNHRIVTTPLIHRDSLQNESDKQVYGNLHLPDNVYIVGTVNMDETTHPFSKKVLDRANTIEFNYIDLAQYPTVEGTPASEGAAVPPNSLLRSEYLQLVDVYHDYKQLTEETTELLVKINGILEQIHSHVGFRIRDAVCFYMIYNDRFALLSKEAAFDMQLLQKILPRIQGSNSSVKKALLQLMQVAQDRSLPITEYMEDASKLYLSPETLAVSKYPQSARKIAFMLRRLEEDGFTSYWLS
ncbi:AAA domain-containing protein [Paenibacillus sp. LMG 31458]|uniref:AAA domain-containing protein n=1 Tax=Paenibacillus phytorum TaxID=2654977 RepID=A0ABX1XZG5_9BACL|nr:HI_0552 family protein [Paenibacillus phytorum]NOU73990.1 AAA domain-containing protein [Paenibacillus phytorum]